MGTERHDVIHDVIAGSHGAKYVSYPLFFLGFRYRFVAEMRGIFVRGLLSRALADVSGMLIDFSGLSAGVHEYSYYINDLCTGRQWLATAFGLFYFF